MAQVLMYLTAACPYCQAASRLLAQMVVTDVQTVRVDLEPASRAEMQARSGQTSVPQNWIVERHIGGFDELYALEREGALDPLLEAERT
jgi:glutaredoxin 3